MFQDNLRLDAGTAGLGGAAASGIVKRGLQLREDGVEDGCQRRVEGGRRKRSNTMKENIINSSFSALSPNESIKPQKGKMCQAQTNKLEIMQDRDTRSGPSSPLASNPARKHISGGAQEGAGGIGNCSFRNASQSRSTYDEHGEQAMMRPMVLACTSQVHTQIGSSLRGMNARGQLQLVECGARRLQAAHFVCSMECGIMRVKFEVGL
jgi:hypothetical protein